MFKITNALLEKSFSILLNRLLAQNFILKFLVELNRIQKSKTSNVLLISIFQDTFYDLSMLEKPTDGREVICHATAWDFYDKKACFYFNYI